MEESAARAVYLVRAAGLLIRHGHRHPTTAKGSSGERLQFHPNVMTPDLGSTIRLALHRPRASRRRNLPVPVHGPASTHRDIPPANSECNRAADGMRAKHELGLVSRSPRCQSTVICLALFRDSGIQDRGATWLSSRPKEWGFVGTARAMCRRAIYYRRVCGLKQQPSHAGISTVHEGDIHVSGGRAVLMDLLVPRDPRAYSSGAHRGW